LGDKPLHFVAFHHFHDCILQENLADPVAFVDSDTGDKLGFTDSDKLPKT
jgi:hypothetical protein